MNLDSTTIVRHVIDDANAKAFKAWASELGSPLLGGKQAHDAYGSATPPDRLSALLTQNPDGSSTVHCMAFFEEGYSEDVIPALTGLWSVIGAGQPRPVTGDLLMVDVTVNERDFSGGGIPYPHVAWMLRPVWPNREGNPFPARAIAWVRTRLRPGN